VRAWVAIAAFTIAVATVLAAVLVDVRHGLPWSTPVIFGNWATRADYERVGTELARRWVTPALWLLPRSVPRLISVTVRCSTDSLTGPGHSVNRRANSAVGPIAKALLSVNYLWLNRAQEPVLLAVRNPLGGRVPVQMSRETWSPAKGTWPTSPCCLSNDPCPDSVVLR
jgi:hypothetical protein